MNPNFSFARWGRLLAHRLTDSAKPLGMALGVVTGLQLVLLLLVRETSFRTDSELWGLFVGFAAVFTAASAFKPMHEGRSATDWLLWPATGTEKWAAAVAETLVLLVSLMLSATLASALLSAAVWIVQGQPAPVWFPWTQVRPANWAALAVFLGVFLAGSSAFRKNALWKTGLALVALGLAIGLLSLAVLRLTGHLTSSGSFGGHGNLGFHLSFGDDEVRRFDGPGIGAVNLLGRLWFYGVVPAFSLAFSWAKVREKEARDEVQ